METGYLKISGERISDGLVKPLKPEGEGWESDKIQGGYKRLLTDHWEYCNLKMNRFKSWKENVPYESYSCSMRKKEDYKAC